MKIIKHCITKVAGRTLKCLLTPSKGGLGCVFVLFLISSCSETKNLAEGELLYTGIKKVNYDKPSKPQADSDTTGVIAAIGNAYNTVEAYLSGSVLIRRLRGHHFRSLFFLYQSSGIHHLQNRLCTAAVRFRSTACKAGQHGKCGCPDDHS